MRCSREPHGTPMILMTFDLLLKLHHFGIQVDSKISTSGITDNCTNVTIGQLAM